jgi:hypothetical protein
MSRRRLGVYPSIRLDKTVQVEPSLQIGQSRADPHALDRLQRSDRVPPSLGVVDRCGAGGELFHQDLRGDGLGAAGEL